MKKYIIFDMDGTLIESDSSNFPLQFKHLQNYLPDLEYDYLKYYSMQTAGTPLIEQLRVVFKSTLDEDTLHKITNELYDIITKNMANNLFFD
jgi:FMN phosphatase YigB (HAD superfamily)